MGKISIFEQITAKFIENLEKGVCPWHKPWKFDGKGNIRLAINWETRRPYAFINQLALAEGEYVTFNQIKKFGGKIKKGAHSYEVYGFFRSTYVANQEEIDNNTTDEVIEPITKVRFSFRFWNVFNINDVEGIESKYPTEAEPTEEPTQTPIECAEEAIKAYVERSGIKFHSVKNDSAYYRPSTDEVFIPTINQYSVKEEYYSTAFHELAHSSGHATRLNRVGITDPTARFGSLKYSQEELIAEMSSAFTLGMLGIDSEKAFDNSTAYLQGWATRLKEKDASKWVAYSAVFAEKATNYILGIKADETEA